jgi:hypothetical protein
MLFIYVLNLGEVRTKEIVCGVVKIFIALARGRLASCGFFNEKLPEIRYSPDTRIIHVNDIS